MKKLKIIETIATIMLSVGVDTIVSNAVKATTPSNTKFVSKGLITISTLVLSGVCGNAAIKYAKHAVKETLKMIDESLEEDIDDTDEGIHEVK